MIGYDKISLNHQLLLGLTFEEMTGLITHDRAKPYHPMTLTGTPPTWHSLPSGLPYIELDGANDFLECPAANSDDFNFVAGDFTLLAWVWLDVMGTKWLFCHGATDVCGFELYHSVINNTIALRTNQLGDHTGISAINSGFAILAWQLVGVTRHLTDGQFYLQGQPIITTLNGGMTDPVTCGVGVKKLLIGIYDTEALGPWNGRIALPRIWNRALSAEEMLQIFSLERHWFGV